jgi:molybdate transport system ATP-binding protein
MLEVDVQKNLGSFSINVAFSVKIPGITALFGPSGAGKTSVVNMVAGLLRPDQGRITVNGNPVFDSQLGIDVPPNRRRLGYVFQDGRLFPHLSVKSNLTYGMKLTNKDGQRVSLDKAVDVLDLGKLLCRRPAKLSGGEKQRVAIGRALLTNPSVLLMDEPLSSLDEARKAEIIPFVLRMQKEFQIPALYVSHSKDEISLVADHVVVIQSGEVSFTGEPDWLSSQKS